MLAVKASLATLGARGLDSCAWVPRKAAKGVSIMAYYHKLRVYHLAVQVLQDIVDITENGKGFGDLHSQVRRAAVSVVSNICEGCSSGNNRQFARYLRIARSSCNEMQGQLEILGCLGSLSTDHQIHDRCDHLGRALSAFIRTLCG